MILFEEAEAILKDKMHQIGIEGIGLSESLGRITGQDIVSTIEMPPFDKSAMDGYAISAADGSARFRVVETIAAGSLPKKEIRRGDCAKIMTGGMMPHGADKVIKKEITEEDGGYMRITGQDSNKNVCLCGEDVKIGDLVLKKGVRIRPPEVGILASMGLSKIMVFKRPVVGIMATGSEIVEPGRHLKKGMIYNSNAYSLEAQAMQMNVLTKNMGLMLDDPDEIQSSIENMLRSCQVVILSGGVSAGDFDYVPGILKNLGFRFHFRKVAIQPGKPVVFATREDKVVFGVPGNPVSTFVIFEIFIKPYLYGMMGHTYKPVLIQGVLKDDIVRKKSTRTAFFPVFYSQGEVKILSYHGSAHINSLGGSNGLVRVARGTKRIPAGSRVDVRSIS